MAQRGNIVSELPFITALTGGPHNEKIRIGSAGNGHEIINRPYHRLTVAGRWDLVEAVQD